MIFVGNEQRDVSRRNMQNVSNCTHLKLGVIGLDGQANKLVRMQDLFANQKSKQRRCVEAALLVRGGRNHGSWH